MPATKRQPFPFRPTRTPAVCPARPWTATKPVSNSDVARTPPFNSANPRHLSPRLTPRRDRPPGFAGRVAVREAARAAPGVPGTGPPGGVRLRGPRTRQGPAAQLRPDRDDRAVPDRGVRGLSLIHI